MSSTHENILLAEAVAHLIRMNESGYQSATGAANKSLTEWLTRSPAHTQALLSIYATWRVLENNSSKLSIDELIAAARADTAGDKVIMLMPPATAGTRAAQKSKWALKLAAAVLVPPLAVAALWYAISTGANTYSNSSAALRRVTLPDGSIVALSPNSQIHLHWTDTERRLDLNTGRARFQVAKNPNRPFFVQTKLSTVRAVGTVFDVEADGSETNVTVIEGQVAVESPLATDGMQQTHRKSTVGASRTSTMQLKAGERASVSDATTRNAKATSLIAWTARQIVFRAAPLSAVVDELNRYRDQRVVINDSELATLLVSGVFDPKDPELLLNYLRQYEGVRTSIADDGSMLLSLEGQPAS
jgi:transmembrane sensor